MTANDLRTMMSDWANAHPRQRETAMIQAAVSAASADDLRSLRMLSRRIFDTVASVHGVVTAEEAQRRDELIARTGLDFDAVNGRWMLGELD